MTLLCITIQEKPLLAVVGKVGCGKISSIVFIIIIIVIHTVYSSSVFAEGATSFKWYSNS